MRKDLKNIINVLFIAILLIGIVLRCYNYFMGRSLWEDEAHLALNFISRGYKGLMEPLDNFQTAPIFFLFSVETFSHIFGYSELALRAFPFLVSIVALPVFYYLVSELTRNKWIALVAFLI
jgi:hypothetical protein